MNKKTKKQTGMESERQRAVKYEVRNVEIHITGNQTKSGKVCGDPGHCGIGRQFLLRLEGVKDSNG